MTKLMHTSWDTNTKHPTTVMNWFRNIIYFKHFAAKINAHSLAHIPFFAICNTYVGFIINGIRICLLEL